MKKFLSMMMLATVVFAACDKVEGDESADDNTVTWGGVTYKTVTLADGNTWMAENLRYVPEGMTVSNTAGDNNGIWYPYNPVKGDDDKYVGVFAEDEATITAKGYLYSTAVAFGVSEITEANRAGFEGVQGICPDGWHIPTMADMMSLVGVASKLNADCGGYSAGETPKNTEAVFYNEDYDGGNIKDMNEQGFGFSYSGAMNNTLLMTGIKGGYEDKPMTYLLGSTFYDSEKSKQYVSLMSNCNATYSDGRLAVAFKNIPMACAVRCVKNK